MSFIDLIVAVDYSVSFRFIGLVGARECNVKCGSFLNLASWVKHVADLSRREKTVYLHRFPSRLHRLHGHLDYVRVFSSLRECNNFINTVKPAILIVDPKLSPYITYPRKISEDKVKRRHERILVLLADNIAYYTYWTLKVRKKDTRELKRILK